MGKINKNNPTRRKTKPTTRFKGSWHQSISNRERKYMTTNLRDTWEGIEHIKGSNND